MASYIKKIKKNNDSIFPQTVAEAVLFQGGETLDEKIETIEDAIEHGGGGTGTVTGAKVGASGELIEPTEGVIVLPEYPTVSTKADKVSGATSGHIATLDANGNLTDGGTSIADMKISNRPFNSTWPTNTTLAAFCAAIVADSSVLVGNSYLGELRCSGLPTGMVNGEVKVDVEGESNSKILVLTVTSTNLSPYH